MTKTVESWDEQQRAELAERWLRRRTRRRRIVGFFAVAGVGAVLLLGRDASQVMEERLADLESWFAVMEPWPTPDAAASEIAAPDLSHLGLNLIEVVDDSDHAALGQPQHLSSGSSYSHFRASSGSVCKIIHDP